MDKYIEIVIISSILLLNACVSVATPSNNPLDNKEDETVTVLFSDSSTLAQENTYYDAMLELQQSHPNQIPSFLIIDAEEKEAIRYYNVEQFPTLLILTGENEKLRIQGTYSKDEILKQLTDLLELEEKKQPTSFIDIERLCLI